MSEIHGVTGSFAVHALDATEVVEFQAHLAVCAACRQEVQELGETAARLSVLTHARPPAALRSSVLSAIRGVRVLPPEDVVDLPVAVEAAVPVAVEAAVPTPQQPAVPPSAPVAPPTSGAPVDELAVRRLRRRSRLLSLAVAAALVAVLAMGGWVADLRAQRETVVAADRQVSQLYSAADVQSVPVELAGGGRGTFVVAKSLNRAMFVADDLPSPGAGRAYQLWTLGGNLSDVPASLRDIRADATFAGGQVRVFFTGDVAAADLVAMTVEQSGGSPTGQPTLDTLQTIQPLDA